MERSGAPFARLLEAEPIQWLVVAAVVALAAATIRPYSAAAVALLVVNSLLTLVRLVPAGRIAERPATALLLAGGVAAAALVAVAPDGSGIVFAFFIAGNAGFRLGTRPALAVAVTTAVLCAIVGLLVDGLPWWLGLLTGTPVNLGMINRSRDARLRAATLAVQQADRAARAEAREQVLAERGRVAREVHDLLAHSLASINMQLEMADALLDVGEVERAREATRKAQGIVRQGMEETQRTVFALRETSPPLVPTLRGMGAAVRVVGAERAVPAQTAHALVRTVQEALTNARKHAPGADVEVVVEFGRDRVTVDVRNGAGAAGDRPLTAAGGGMGLVGMRERMAEVGGSVAAGPADGGGWRVHAEVPAPAAAGPTSDRGAAGGAGG